MPSAPAKGKGAVGVVTRKVGPLPLWAWVVLGVGGYVVFRGLMGKGGGATPSTPMSAGGLPVSGGGGASSGGSPAPTDAAGISNTALANLLGFEEGQQSNLIGGLLGAQNTFAAINSNLVSGLMNSTNAVTSMGESALGYNGQLEQAIIQSYVPPAAPAPSSPASTGGFNSSGPPAYTPPPTTATSIVATPGFGTSVYTSSSVAPQYYSQYGAALTAGATKI